MENNTNTDIKNIKEMYGKFRTDNTNLDRDKEVDEYLKKLDDPKYETFEKVGFIRRIETLMNNSKKYDENPVIVSPYKTDGYDETTETVEPEPLWKQVLVATLPETVSNAILQTSPDQTALLKTQPDPPKLLLETPTEVVYDYAIIGNGPVGLVTAVAFAKSKPSSDIIIFGNRTEYSRKQVVLINPMAANALNDIDPGILEEIKKVGCFVPLPPTAVKAECWTEGSKPAGGPTLVSVRIDILEQTLTNYLKKFNNVTLEIPISANIKDTVFSNIDNTITWMEQGIKYSKQYKNIIFAMGTRGNQDGFTYNYRFGKPETQTTDKLWGLVYAYGLANTQPNFSGNELLDKYKIPQHRYRMFKTKDNSSIYFGILFDDTEKNEAGSQQYFDDISKDYIKLLSGWDLSGVNPIGKDLPKPFPITITKRKKNIVKTSDGEGFAACVGDNAVNTNFFTGAGLQYGFTCIKNLVDYDDATDKATEEVAIKAYEKCVSDNAELALISSKKIVFGEPCNAVDRINQLKMSPYTTEGEQKALRVMLDNLGAKEFCRLFKQPPPQLPAPLPVTGGSPGFTMGGAAIIGGCAILKSQWSFILVILTILLLFFIYMQYKNQIPYKQNYHSGSSERKKLCMNTM